jgi:membrane fusion protein
MPRSLFRKEAIDAQREKFLGEASVAQPVKLWVFTAMAVAIAAIVIAVAVWGQYTRRERVQGYLSSAVGAAQVRMPDAGVVSDVMVKEGDVVSAGAPLARLTIDRAGINDARGNEAVLREMTNRKTLLDQEHAQAENLGRQQVAQLRDRIASLQEEVRQVDSEINLQSERMESARSIARKWKQMQDEHAFASDILIQQKLDEVKDQEIKVQTLRRQRASFEKELAQARSDIPTTQMRTRTALEQIDRQGSEVSQNMAEQSVKREQDVKRDMIITAPIDGTITNIGPARGQTVAADTPFATLLPKDSALHAELLVPTRAIGFVHPGQPVMLRYEAFPYERFGQYAGKVENVGKSIWTQGDSVGPLAVREPVYRIVVKLDEQNITSSGDKFPLRAGMVVSADLLMEKRTLLEWLFQPVLQLRQRVRTSTGAPS